MLSHDSITHWMGRPLEMDEQVAMLVANWHPTHIFENIVPQLKERGISDEDIDQLFYLNEVSSLVK